MLVYKPELDSLYDNVLLFGNKRIVSMDVEEYLNGSLKMYCRLAHLRMYISDYTLI